MLQYPGQHAAGGGLAVGTGNRQYPAPLQDMVGQPLGTRNVRQALVQHILHRRVAARQGIADHHQVRRRVELGGVITLGQFDALSLQLRAHGRVDVGVGAGDVMAKLLGEDRQRAHERAADTENMNVHD
ncbi:hypothetical protein D3C80_1022870 [compost metagenome]